MREYIGRTRRPLMAVGALVLVLTAAACRGGESSRDVLGGDDALGRDLALAAQDSVQPAFTDVAEMATPAPAPAPVAEVPAPRAPVPGPTTPRATAPRPTAPTAAVPTTAVPSAPAPEPAPEAAPAPAVPAEGVIAAGTSMRFATTSQVCTGVTTVGDRFTARVSGAIDGGNGARIPSGATGTFEVVTAKRAQNQNDDSYLTVRLVSVTVDGSVYPVQATTQSATTERVRVASPGTDAKKVATGAVVGAIAGRILGKDTKGAVVGAAAGAAAGTAAAVGTADFDTCLNSGAVITVTLSAPLTVKVGS
jgi:hypothetical protein